MTFRRLVPFFLLLGAIAFTAETAEAFCRSKTCGNHCQIDPVSGCPLGIPIFWPQSCVSYSMQFEASKNIDLATATRIAENAFATWQKAQCSGGGSPSIKVDHTFGPVACKAKEYNQVDGNANIIMFDDPWPYAPKPDESGDPLALTTVTFGTKTGEIYDADIEINAEQRLSTSDPVDPASYDLQSILTHETGHFFGLAHSLDPDATMWGKHASGSDVLRDLTPDDIDGICTVYPPTSSVETCNDSDYTPRQGFSAECGIFPAGTGACQLSPVTLGAHRRNPEEWALLALAAGFVAGARHQKRRAS